MTLTSTPALRPEGTERADRSTTAVALQIATAITGRVVTPDSLDWDAARQGFNLAVDFRPAMIVLPRSPGDVAATVDLARAAGLTIAAQATGHNAGAHADVSDTVLIDLRELREVSIDAERLRVRVGAGVQWKDVVPRLSELGLAGLHGSSPLVGIAGYSLGGGIGWLSRKHGLQTNAVTAFEVVTADGRQRRVDADHDADLFWALRGGNGNFAVVTAIEFAVVRAPELYAGNAFFPIERAGEVMHAWRAMCAGLPEETTTWLALLRFPDLPDVPEPVRGQAFAVLQAVHLGPADEGERLLAPVRGLGPVMDTFAEVEPAALADLAMDPTEPVPYLSTTALLDELSEDSVDRLLAAAGPDSGTPLVLVQLRHVGGALNRAPEGAGARATLPGEFNVFALGVPFDADVELAVRESLAAVDAAVAEDRVGYYPNFVEHPAEARAFFDVVTWSRLRRVKAAHDPGDLFRGNHRITPADVHA